MGRAAGGTWIPDEFTGYGADLWWLRNTESFEDTLMGTSVVEPALFQGVVPVDNSNVNNLPEDFDVWPAPAGWQTFDALVTTYVHVGLDVGGSVIGRLFVRSPGGTPNEPAPDSAGRTFHAFRLASSIVGATDSLQLAAKVQQIDDPLPPTQYQILAARRS